MKNVIFAVLIMLTSVNVYSQDTLHTCINAVDSCFLESHIINDCDEITCGCIIPSWEMKMIYKHGFCFNHNIEKKRFENKTIGYIIKDLSVDYEYLGSITANDFERLKPDDIYKRNAFIFYFKYNDTTILRLHGCINYNRSKLIYDDEEALEYIESQNKFVMNFVQLDVAKYLQKLEKDDVVEYEKDKDFEWEIMKKHYFDIIPVDKRDLIKH